MFSFCWFQTKFNWFIIVTRIICRLRSTTHIRATRCQQITFCQYDYIYWLPVTDLDWPLTQERWQRHQLVWSCIHTGLEYYTDASIIMYINNETFKFCWITQRVNPFSSFFGAIWQAILLVVIWIHIFIIMWQKDYDGLRVIMRVEWLFTVSDHQRRWIEMASSRVQRVHYELFQVIIIIPLPNYNVIASTLFNIIRVRNERCRHIETSILFSHMESTRWTANGTNW
jgi:hypothetical protein